MNLPDALAIELSRNREMLKVQEKFPECAFSAAIIRDAILSGEKAITGGDTAIMLRAYTDLGATG